MNANIEDDNFASDFSNYESDAERERARQQLIRKGKLLFYNRKVMPDLDESVVSVQRYHAFGTSLFPSNSADARFTVGITSASPGDGKTVVAANLATFLALDTEDDTVLVDLNFSHPKQHAVFGVPSSPGILDAVDADTITLSRTSIKGLWLVPLGALAEGKAGLNRILEVREVIATLKQHFRFVVIDLPSARDPNFPTMLTSQLDGYIVVVSVGKTKKTEVTSIMPMLNENKVIGFVMNRVSHSTPSS
ncbi:MAG: hypothetical protein C4326_06265 [Ignavibacteria bacterium]